MLRGIGVVLLALGVMCLPLGLGVVYGRGVFWVLADLHQFWTAALVLGLGGGVFFLLWFLVPARGPRWGARRRKGE